ncbi:MAG TPA: adenylate/guanylate cyclase domain-containing protein, partial [Bacillota bacterium]|nr:adenylate/guanylate cyclase domain-containing protein [Bacillota bacterium]
IRTLLDGGLVQPGPLARLAATAVVALVAAALSGWLGPLAGGLAVAVLLLAVVVWSAVSLALGTAVDAAGPLAAGLVSWVAVVVWRLGDEQAARARLVGLFGRHVGPEVVRSLLEAPERRPATGGVRQPVTALFLDMRGFTALAGAQDPESVVALLNRVFAQVVPVIIERGGMLDKFIGDGLLAIWNAPVAAPDHAARALAAAVEMQARLGCLAAEELAAHGVHLGFGIGIHTGEAVVGTVGTPTRQEYTAIGSTINLAARLQEQAGSGEILVSAAVWEAAGAAGGMVATPRDVPIRGQAEALPALAVTACLR